ELLDTSKLALEVFQGALMTALGVFFVSKGAPQPASSPAGGWYAPSYSGARHDEARIRSPGGAWRRVPGDDSHSERSGPAAPCPRRGLQLLRRRDRGRRLRLCIRQGGGVGCTADRRSHGPPSELHHHGGQRAQRGGGDQQQRGSPHPL